MDLDERIKIGEKILMDFLEIIFEHVSEIDEDFSLKEHFLIELVGQKGAVKMSELASFFFISLPTMTSMVQRLVERGYLKRCRSEEDRRIVLISLSTKGEGYYQNHRQEYMGIFKESLLNLSEKEIKTASKFLTKVKRAILNK